MKYVQTAQSPAGQRYMVENPSRVGS